MNLQEAATAVVTSILCQVVSCCMSTEKKTFLTFFFCEHCINFDTAFYTIKSKPVSPQWHNCYVKIKKCLLCLLWHTKNTAIKLTKTLL